MNNFNGMIFIVIFLSSAVFLLYAFLKYRSRKARDGILGELGYFPCRVKNEVPSFDAEMISDFLSRGICLSSSRRKDINNGVLYFLDVLSVFGRGAYSGPSHVSCLLFKPAFHAPDFKLRAARLLETKYELRGSSIIDESKKLHLWGDFQAESFIASNRALSELLGRDAHLCLNVEGGCMLLWSLEGFFRNHELESYLSTFENSFRNVRPII